MKSKNFERYRKNFDLMKLFPYRWKAFHEKAHTKRAERIDFSKHPPCHLCYNKLVIGKRKPHAPKRLVRLSPIRAPRRTENIHLSCHLNTNYKKQEAR